MLSNSSKHERRGLLHKTVLLRQGVDQLGQNFVAHNCFCQIFGIAVVECEWPKGAPRRVLNCDIVNLNADVEKCEGMGYELR